MLKVPVFIALFIVFAGSIIGSHFLPYPKFMKPPVVFAQDGDNGRCLQQAETREIIKVIWKYWKQGLADGINHRLDTDEGKPACIYCPIGDNNCIPSPVEDIKNNRCKDNLIADTYVLYDYQVHTQNLLEYAYNCHDLTLLEELTDVFRQAYPYLTDDDQDGYKEWYDRTNTNPAKWGEIPLIASQYSFLISRAVNIITSLNPSQQTPKLKEFVKQSLPVIIDAHLQKWITGTDKAKKFSVYAWGCKDASGKRITDWYNHKEFLQKKLDRSLGVTPTYCNTFSDTDLYIIAITAEILSADKKSNLINLSQSQIQEFKDYVALGTKVIQSRLTETNLSNFQNQPVKGYNFGPGESKDHPGNAYAGYTGITFPVEADKKTVDSISWDISHARRFVHVFDALYRDKEATGQTFPAKEDIQKFANQIAYKIFNRDFEKPLFSNFWDGTNGWYRVNYSGRVGFAYAPSDLSMSICEGGYGFWGEFNPDMDKILNSCAKIYLTDDPQIIDWRKNKYWALYNDYKRAYSTPARFDKTKSLVLLQMLTALYSANIPISTPTPNPTSILPTISPANCPNKSQGDANCDGNIDDTDYRIWRCFFVSGGYCLGPFGNFDPDFNKDRIINLIDLEIWRRNRFGQ